MSSVKCKKVTDFQRDTSTAWENGCFLIHGIEPPEFPADYQSRVAPAPYEGFMTAWVLPGTRYGKVGGIVVDFPADKSEENFLHTHGISARELYVLKGTGWFIAKRNDTISAAPLTAGDKILMPVGIRHTFLAGSSGMTLLSFHGPFLGLEGPEVIQATEDTVDLDAFTRGSLTLPTF